MLVEYVEHPVGVRLIPEDFEAVEEVVAKEDVGLCDEVFVGVRVENLFNPVEHVASLVTVSPILIEGVHSIEIQDHDIGSDFIHIPSTGVPCALDRCVCCHR